MGEGQNACSLDEITTEGGHTFDTCRVTVGRKGGPGGQDGAKKPDGDASGGNSSHRLSLWRDEHFRSGCSESDAGEGGGGRGLLLG